jgi:hypothetical protein
MGSGQLHDNISFQIRVAHEILRILSAGGAPLTEHHHGWQRCGAEELRDELGLEVM